MNIALAVSMETCFIDVFINIQYIKENAVNELQTFFLLTWWHNMDRLEDDSRKF